MEWERRNPVFAGRHRRFPPFPPARRQLEDSYGLRRESPLWIHGSGNCENRIRRQKPKRRPTTHSKESKMRLKRICGRTRIIASGLVLLGGSSLALAGGYCRHCNPCPNGANGDFFGYYPTNWRPWPGVMVNSVTPVTPTPEPIPAPADTAKPMPSGPQIQQAPPPRSVDKTPEQASVPLPLETATT